MSHSFLQSNESSCQTLPLHRLLLLMFKMNKKIAVHISMAANADLLELGSRLARQSMENALKRDGNNRNGNGNDNNAN